MQLEFLAKSEGAYKRLWELAIPDVVARTTADMGQGPHCLRIVTFAMAGNSIDTAKILARVRDEAGHDDLVLLRDGPSRRFETDLYRMFTEFERELRRILALYRAINSEEGDKVLDHPDEHDFGTLFSALFVDKDFVGRAKKVVNAKGGSFEKEELIQRLLNEEESAYWDALFPADAMPTVRKRHADIRKYRNDVMHSHIMTAREYGRAKRLMERAIDEMVEFSSQDISGDAAVAAEELSRKSAQEAAKAVAEALKRIQAESGFGAIAQALSAYGVKQDEIGRIVREAWLDANEPILSAIGADSFPGEQYRLALEPLARAGQRAVEEPDGEE